MDDFFSNNPTLFALIGTLFGGVGLRLTEYWLSKSSVKDSLATQIRTELRQEIEALKQELQEAKKEADLFREKYYEFREEAAKELESTKADFQRIIQDLRRP